MNGEGQATRHASKKHFPNQPAQHPPALHVGAGVPHKGVRLAAKSGGPPSWFKAPGKPTFRTFLNFHRTQSTGAVQLVPLERGALPNLEQVLEITHVSIVGFAPPTMPTGSAFEN